MIPIAASATWPLGKFTIRAQPLESNPFWTTHLIFLAAKLIGKQLSPPTLDDCRWFEKRGGVYAQPEESAPVSQPISSSFRRQNGGRTTARKTRKRRRLNLQEIIELGGQG